MLSAYALAGYSASKDAVVNLTQHLAIDYAKELFSNLLCSGCTSSHSFPLRPIFPMTFALQFNINLTLLWSPIQQ